jgi:pimeloyl-ACP methyl ester carboxylesterase
VPWIDANLPTTGTRDGRAIGGLSMGGLGAMHYAATRPDLFTSASSFSGAIDTNVFVAPPIVELLTLGEATHLPAAAFGLRATEEIRWRGHNPVDLAENLRGLRVTLDTGTGDPGDPVEMAMHQMNASMHDTLDHFGVDHEYRTTPGCHCWYLWEQHLAKVLPGLMDRFAQPVATPSPFTYKSIDARYRMYGWDVAIDRPAIEWSRLFDAGPSGFGLTGSGTARVTTGATFESGQRVPVTIRDAAGTRTTELVADRAGRLTVPVALGPGNPLQQHSPAGNLWAIAQGLPPGEWPTVTARVTFG